VLDISGSMASEAYVKNKDGVKESHGMSYLDLLKHAVKTVITNLGPEDRFSLVTYSTHARIDYPLNNMDENNKAVAIDILEKLTDEECTNIWEGL